MTDDRLDAMMKTFNSELASLYESRPPVSKAKMIQITKAALKAIKYYKHVVLSVEKFIQKCKPEYKIPGLYVIDSIVRQSRHQFGAERDLFGPRFARNMCETFRYLLTCNESDKNGVIRVLNLWKKNAVFDQSILDPLFALTAGGNGSVKEPVKEAVSANVSSAKVQETFSEQSKIDPKNINPGLLQQIEFLTGQLVKQGAAAEVRQTESKTGVTKFLSDEFDYSDDEEEAGNQNKISVSNIAAAAKNILENTHLLQQIKDMQQKGTTGIFQSDSHTLGYSQAQHGPTPVPAPRPMGMHPGGLPFGFNEGVSAGDRASLMEDNSNNCPPEPLPPGAARGDKDERNRFRDKDERELDRNKDKKKRSRRCSRSRSRSKGRTRDNKDTRHRSRSGSRKRNRRSRSRSAEKRDKERERRKQGMLPAKPRHLAVYSQTLWFGRISSSCTENDIIQAVKDFGTPVTIDIIAPRGCAYIVMPDRKSAFKVLDRLQDELRIGGRQIKMAWAPGKGVKEAFKDFWDGESGVTNIPWTSVMPDSLSSLMDGGYIDPESVPDFLTDRYEGILNKVTGISEPVPQVSVNTAPIHAVEVQQALPAMPLTPVGGPYMSQLPGPQPIMMGHQMFPPMPPGMPLMAQRVPGHMPPFGGVPLRFSSFSPAGGVPVVPGAPGQAPVSQQHAAVAHAPGLIRTPGLRQEHQQFQQRPISVVHPNVFQVQNSPRQPVPLMQLAFSPQRQQAQMAQMNAAAQAYSMFHSQNAVQQQQQLQALTQAKAVGGVTSIVNTFQQAQTAGAAAPGTQQTSPNWKDGAGRSFGGQGGDDRRSGGPRAENWDCSSCGNNNYGFRRECNKCHAQRTSGPAATVPYHRGGGRGGGGPRGDRAPNWTCAECESENFGYRHDCFKCHVPRPGAGDDGDFNAGQGNFRGGRAGNRGGYGRFADRRNSNTRFSEDDNSDRYESYDTEQNPTVPGEEAGHYERSASYSGQAAAAEPEAASVGAFAAKPQSEAPPPIVVPLRKDPIRRSRWDDSDSEDAIGAPALSLSCTAVAGNTDTGASSRQSATYKETNDGVNVEKTSIMESNDQEDEEDATDELEDESSTSKPPSTLQRGVGNFLSFLSSTKNSNSNEQKEKDEAEMPQPEEAPSEDAT